MAPKVLSALDTAKTQFYHFKAIIIAGMGLFTDAYSLFCISPVMELIGRVYYDQDVEDEQKRYDAPPVVMTAMLGIALLGTVIGQLVFGRLGDCKGRRGVYGAALLLIIFSSVGSGFSIGRSRTHVLLSLGFFRFLLGIGIGGDYPLSATIMSEYANKRTRGGFIAAVFSMQGFGILVGSIVTMVVCAIFNGASHARPTHTPEVSDLAWRLVLMIGAIPAGLTFYWRISMPETARYTALVEKNVLQATKDMQKVLDMSISPIPEEEEIAGFNTSLLAPSYTLCSKEFFRRHSRDLFSCAISWFFVDIVFYSSNLFPSKIYKQFLPEKENINAYEEAFHVARLQAIMAICSTIPGYFATVYFIDRIGRVKIQMLGFFFMAVWLFTIGSWQNNTKLGYMFLYGLTFFFANFGPNTTTFIVPAELFPARFRSTCHGISGAAGKFGAIIGSLWFLWASPSNDQEKNGHRNGIGATAFFLAAVSVLGMITTFFFTQETKGRSLEENEINHEHQSTAGSSFSFRDLRDCIKPKQSISNERVANATV